MKAMMILGSMLGFVAGVGGSLLGNCAWSTTFWHASVAALVGGFLGRWWGRIWFTGLADALEQQRRAAAQAKAEAKHGAKP
jgi:hypothetical protein